MALMSRLCSGCPATMAGPLSPPLSRPARLSSCRLPVGEFNADDRLRTLEAIFPRHDQPDRRAVLFEQGMPVHAACQEGQFIRRLSQRQPLGIGPGHGAVRLLASLLRPIEGSEAN